jgi:hypothetical protein
MYYTTLPAKWSSISALLNIINVQYFSSVDTLDCVQEPWQWQSSVSDRLIAEPPCPPPWSPASSAASGWTRTRWPPDKPKIICSIYLSAAAGVRPVKTYRVSSDEQGRQGPVAEGCPPMEFIYCWMTVFGIISPVQSLLVHELELAYNADHCICVPLCISFVCKWITRLIIY